MENSRYIIQNGKTRRLSSLVGILFLGLVLLLALIDFSKMLPTNFLMGLGWLLFIGGFLGGVIKSLESIFILKIEIDSVNHVAIFNTTFQNVKIGKENIEKWGIVRDRKFFYVSYAWWGFEPYINFWCELKDGRKFVYPLPYISKFDEYIVAFKKAFEKESDSDYPQFAKQYYAIF